MRVVVVGATGNVGTSVLHALANEPAVNSVLGVARRLPSLSFPKTEWAAADIVSDPLEPLFAGADAVVHLAWLIQPSRRLHVTRAVNVDGSARVFRAAGKAGVGALVYASSVGAYSPGPKDRFVDESWPTGGIESSFYSRHKSEVERLLDRFEAEFPQVRSVRLRPGLIPVVPSVERLRFQAVHSLDVGEAYRLAVVRDSARGAYNVAADPVLDPERLGSLLDARPVGVPAGALRRAADLTWRLRLQPSPVGWVDMALGVPLMSTARARDELGWTPRRTAGDALLELLAGMRDRSGADTPPLRPGAGGPLRLRELLTGLGSTSR